MRLKEIRTYNFCREERLNKKGIEELLRKERIIKNQFQGASALEFIKLKKESAEKQKFTIKRKEDVVVVKKFQIGRAHV